MTEMVNNGLALLEEVEAAVLGGGELGWEQALELARLPEELLPQLSRLADRVRRAFSQEAIDLCSIINARSGRCAEDCKFCPQSNHYPTEVSAYPMKPAAEIVAAAKQAEAGGAHRFCIVTSGEAVSGRDFETVLEAVDGIKKETGIKRCASLGRLTPQRAALLKEAGLDRYHHNIETAPSFFGEVCSTHSYQDKAETITHLKGAGIEPCVGGILNLGESAEQRLEFAFRLREIDPVSVPVNFLNPRPGTPLADRPIISSLEAAKYLAIFRLILPRTYLRLAGGRLQTFGGQPALPFSAGVNGLLIGDLLTTPGREVKADLTLLQCLGFDLDGAQD